MLVTFKTNAAHPDINMFGTAAVSLLKLMGQSGNVPGAIMAEDIPAALDRLERGLSERDDTDTVEPAVEASSGAGGFAPDGDGHPNVDDDDDDEVEAVSLSRRATPLAKMLEVAHEEGTSVRWDD